MRNETLEIHGLEFGMWNMDFKIWKTDSIFHIPNSIFLPPPYIIFFLINAGMSKFSSSDVFAATVVGTGCAGRGAFVGA
jgi:hypothetical protein